MKRCPPYNDVQNVLNCGYKTESHPSIMLSEKLHGMERRECRVKLLASGYNFFKIRKRSYSQSIGAIRIRMHHGDAAARGLRVAHDHSASRRRAARATHTGRRSCGELVQVTESVHGDDGCGGSENSAALFAYE